MTNEVDRVFDFIPIETLSCLRLCSWPFSILQGSRILMNVDDSRFSALGVTAPDEAISHPIPPVRVEGEGPHLRLRVDVGAHSKIDQQLEKGLISWMVSRKLEIGALQSSPENKARQPEKTNLKFRKQLESSAVKVSESPKTSSCRKNNFDQF
jgi:hypothetical protein